MDLVSQRLRTEIKVFKIPEFDQDDHNSNFKFWAKTQPILYKDSLIPYICDDMTIVYSDNSCSKSPTHRNAMKILHAFRNRLNFRKIKFR